MENFPLLFAKTSARLAMKEMLIESGSVRERREVTSWAIILFDIQF